VNDANEKIEYWLSHDKERKEFAVNAYEDLKKNVVFTEYIKKCLEG
jgi:spore maturation protein CgeB